MGRHAAACPPSGERERRTYAFSRAADSVPGRTAATHAGSMQRRANQKVDPRGLHTYQLPRVRAACTSCALLFQRELKCALSNPGVVLGC